MKAGELKQAEKAYKLELARVRQLTVADFLGQESKEERLARIKRLLTPQDYGLFWNYYFGVSAGGNLGDKPCASFHKEAYWRLHQNEEITQFRVWFRGSGKSLQTNVGNALALKFRGKLKFMLLVAINETRAKLLLADLQVQLEANERILADFGKQVSHGHWKEGMFETTDGCYFMALGIDQPFRGLRRYANRIDFAVVDDCEDAQTARNQRIVGERCDKVTKDLLAAFLKNEKGL